MDSSIKTGEGISLASNQSRRNLLDQTRLSRLPENPNRPKFQLPNFAMPSPAAVCVGCSGKLEADNDFQHSIKGCRKCIGIYTRIDAAIEEASKRKTREQLEKLVGGGKDGK